MNEAISYHSHPSNDEINSLSQETIWVCMKKRQELLDSYRKKQNFRVAVGVPNQNFKWVNYETFNPKYNLREVLDDEVVQKFMEIGGKKDETKWKVVSGNNVKKLIFVKPLHRYWRKVLLKGEK